MESEWTQEHTKKIGIIFDTNILYRSINFYNPTNLEGNIRQIKDTIIDLKIDDLVDLVLPDIVLEELRRQYIEDYQEQVKKVKNIIKRSDFPGISIRYDEKLDIEEFTIESLQSIRTNLLNKHGILNNMKMNEVSFDSILTRALEKRRPFEGEKGRADKGFKDAVLWENILCYRNNFPQYRLILLTNDKAFDQNLVEEYQYNFDEEIKIFRKQDEILDFLASVVDQIPESLAEEIEESKYVRKILQNSKDVLQNQYKHWMEELEAFGSGIEVTEITDFTINNLIPAKYASYNVEGDYLALVKVKATGFSNGITQIFNSELYIDISIKENKYIYLDITGITASA